MLRYTGKRLFGHTRLLFQGWMEKKAMFNGFYTDKKVKVGDSKYNIPLAFFLVTVAVMLFSLIIMVRR